MHESGSERRHSVLPIKLRSGIYEAICNTTMECREARQARLDGRGKHGIQTR